MSTRRCALCAPRLGRCSNSHAAEEYEHTCTCWWPAYRLALALGVLGITSFSLLFLVARSSGHAGFRGIMVPSGAIPADLGAHVACKPCGLSPECRFLSLADRRMIFRGSSRFWRHRPHPALWGFLMVMRWVRWWHTMRRACCYIRSIFRGRRYALGSK